MKINIKIEIDDVEVKALVRRILQKIDLTCLQQIRGERNVV